MSRKTFEEKIEEMVAEEQTAVEQQAEETQVEETASVLRLVSSTYYILCSY